MSKNDSLVWRKNSGNYLVDRYFQLEEREARKRGAWKKIRYTTYGLLSSIKQVNEVKKYENPCVCSSTLISKNK